MTTTLPRPGAATELAAALAAATPGHRLRSVTIDLPGPLPDPVAIAEAAIAAGEETVAWARPADGVALAGIGRAWAVEAAGPGRFAEASTAWAALADDLAAASAGRSAPAGPLLLGGLGFTGRVPAAEDPWAPFGAASLVLPELIVAVVGGQATLTATLPAGETTFAALAGRWERLSAAARSVAGSEDGDRAAAAITSLPARAEWDRLVGLLAGAVGRGRLDKVVLARRTALEGASLPGLATILGRLAASAPEAALFAFHRSGQTFLGGTPERLARVDGRAFRTVAIAGSTRRGATPAEDAMLAAALLGSDKDREEHALVVAALRERLAPLAERLELAPGPGILPLRDLQHLVTPVEGRLHERAGVLLLAGALHPTPAVAGTPLEPALAAIEEHEGFDRGWYAGPVGWVAPDGDGELMVALRCGVLDGDRAWLFAGCGIVADSDPAREWEESRLKLRPMLGALGIGEVR